jgi:hypothetical protein
MPVATDIGDEEMPNKDGGQAEEQLETPGQTTVMSAYLIITKRQFE